MKSTQTEPSSSVAALERPRVTHHLLAGAITVELSISHAGTAYTVTAEYARAHPQRSPLVSVEPAATTEPVPTRLVPVVLYLALDELWHLETAALNREDAHSVNLWHGAYTAISAFRSDWLDAQADDIDETDDDEGAMDSPERMLLVLPGPATPSARRGVVAHARYACP